MPSHFRGVTVQSSRSFPCSSPQHQPQVPGAADWLLSSSSRPAPLCSASPPLIGLRSSPPPARPSLAHERAALRSRGGSRAARSGAERSGASSAASGASCVDGTRRTAATEAVTHKALDLSPLVLSSPPTRSSTLGPRLSEEQGVAKAPDRFMCQCDPVCDGSPDFIGSFDNLVGRSLASRVPGSAHDSVGTDDGFKCSDSTTL
ncbi:hypothetical protein F2P81_002769 [Scophthalmus maximus]|uniref:Uncharacterized protein n=1 Tax=Scophthalmus maximus TaxID=52904 RepID=A0A6A4TRK6_SCOMX|nr:hypothetical protein F2P81_002769 [Scophthalmus maximus]